MHKIKLFNVERPRSSTTQEQRVRRDRWSLTQPGRSTKTKSHILWAHWVNENIAGWKAQIRPHSTFWRGLSKGIIQHAKSMGQILQVP